MDRAISKLFQADHLRLDGLLRQAEAGCGAIDAGAFAAFRTGLLTHIAVEEKILLPAARRLRGGEPLPMARRIRVDHGAIALLLIPSPTQELIAEIRSILEPHNRLEEAPDGFYAICDELLAEEAEALLAEVRAYPEVRAAPYRDGPRICRSAREALRISERHSAYKDARGRHRGAGQ